MPNRIIRESCRTSATLYQLSHGAERCFWRLTTVADDFGRFEADPRLLKANCFPLWDGKLSTEDVASWLDEMVTAGLVSLYATPGKMLGYFISWAKHQDVRAKKSKYPDPSPASICGQMFAKVPVSVSVSVSESVSESVSGIGVLGAANGAAPVSNGHSNGHKQQNLDIPPKLLEKVPLLSEWPSVQALMALWNFHAAEAKVPQIETLSERRRERAKRLLRQFPDWRWWNGSLGMIKRSKFLTGQVAPQIGHSKAFVADFDWLLANGKDGVENIVKLFEGKYER